MQFIQASIYLFTVLRSLIHFTFRIVFRAAVRLWHPLLTLPMLTAVADTRLTVLRPCLHQRMDIFPSYEST